MRECDHRPVTTRPKAVGQAVSPADADVMTANEPVTTSPVPDYRTLRMALQLAERAPSVHNTQPWRWVFDGARLHLHADPDRLLPATDPRGRQRVISCGAMLH